MNIRNSIYKEFPVFIQEKESYYELKIEVPSDATDYEYEVYGKEEYIHANMHVKSSYTYPKYVFIQIKEMQNLFFQISIKQDKKSSKYYSFIKMNELQKCEHNIKVDIQKKKEQMDYAFYKSMFSDVTSVKSYTSEDESSESEKSSKDSEMEESAIDA
jgi:hypothetical protein